jgi:ComF family protein
LGENEEQICLQCLCKLPRTLFHRQDDNPLVWFFAGKIPILHATAFLYYRKKNAVSHLTHTFKYRGNKQLAFQLGRLAALEYTPCRQIDLLIPVPLHPKKEKKRGYNQSEWICMGLASVWNIPVRTDVLRRKTPTSTQTGKLLHDRWRNMQNAFFTENAEVLQGQHVLLVDDVVTSGSTLVACAEALVQIPGVRVSIFALSIA